MIKPLSDRFREAAELLRTQMDALGQQGWGQIGVDMRDGYLEAANTVDALQSQLTAANERIARLEGALRELLDDVTNEATVWAAGSSVEIARAALKENHDV